MSVAQLLHACDAAWSGASANANAAAPVSLAFPLVIPEFELPSLPQLPPLGADTADAIRAALDGFDEKIAAMNAGLEAAEDLCKAIAGAGELTADILGWGVEAMGEVVVDEITEIFNGAFEGLDDAVGEVMEDIAGAADEVLSVVDEFITPAEEVAGIYIEFKPMFQAMAALQ